MDYAHIRNGVKFLIVNDFHNTPNRAQMIKYPRFQLVINSIINQRGEPISLLSPEGRPKHSSH